jgi:hypothetical protein
MTFKTICSQQGFAKSGAEVLHSTFVLLISICAKLKLPASNPPPSASPEPLQASQKNRQCNNEQTEETSQKQPFAKLKEVFCQRTSRYKNTTINFAQPHNNTIHYEMD